MTFASMTRRVAIAAATAFTLAAGPFAASAEKMLDDIHFLIPGGAGGGWDGTAKLWDSVIDRIGHKLQASKKEETPDTVMKRAQSKV